jgi:hypothetical protein
VHLFDALIHSMLKGRRTQRVVSKRQLRLVRVKGFKPVLRSSALRSESWIVLARVFRDESLAGRSGER